MVGGLEVEVPLLEVERKGEEGRRLTSQGVGEVGVVLEAEVETLEDGGEGEEEVVLTWEVDGT